jgi:hypothetical protein
MAYNVKPTNGPDGVSHGYCHVCGPIVIREVIRESEDFSMRAGCDTRESSRNAPRRTIPDDSTPSQIGGMDVNLSAAPVRAFAVSGRAHGEVQESATRPMAGTLAAADNSISPGVNFKPASPAAKFSQPNPNHAPGDSI